MNIRLPLIARVLHDIFHRRSETVHLPPFLNDLIHNCLFLSHFS